MRDTTTRTSLTNTDFWHNFYLQRDNSYEIDVRGFRNRPTRIVANLIEEIGLENKSILEIGAGNSAWISYFAKKYSQSHFVGIDYSEEGCKKLQQRLLAERIANVDMYNKDMFEIDERLAGAFDIVLSFGLVEHFSDLHYVLKAKKEYVKKNGYLFTLIPNMSGIIGYLTKKWGPEIYAAHNPHDWVSFTEGHQKAGLHIVKGGYLLSSGFGVLSSVFLQTNSADPPKRSQFLFYLYLSRLSKLGYLFEDLFFALPATKFFSPYIYAISRPA